MCAIANVSAFTVWFLYGHSISTKVRKSTPVHNLDADQSVGFINFKRIKAVNYSSINTS